MMRSTIAALSLGFLAATGLFTATRDARAEEQFNVSVSGKTVTVTAKGDWHINQSYPWKLTVGDQKFDKSKFSLGEKAASVSASAGGSATLKGAVCHADQCMPFERSVTLQ